MELGSRRTTFGVVGTTVACLLGAALLAGGQAAPAQKPGRAVAAQKPLMAEQAFKNVQVLKGIPVNEFMQTMGFFSGSLGQSCEYCHVPDSAGNWAKYADETRLKVTTRRMILMVQAINNNSFGGARVVTCYSCHRGDEQPKVMPSLAEVYGAPPDELPEPDVILQGPSAPTADQVLDKYLQALGGTQRLAAVTSFVAKGIYHPYVGESATSVIEIFAKAPGQLTTIVHGNNGDTTTTYDGRAGWIAAPATDRPVPLLPLLGADLEAAKVDANLALPVGIKKTFTEWQVGFPVTIDNRKVQVIQATTAVRSHIKLYFDMESGLLVRQVRISDLATGPIPAQVDYADYREVAGIKMPFRWTVTWLDGRTSTELTDVQPNAPIDAVKFSKPSPPKPVSQ